MVHQVTDECYGPQFKKLVFGQITINVTSSADCYVGTVDGSIVKVKNICYDFKNKNKIIVIIRNNFLDK